MYATTLNDTEVNAKHVAPFSFCESIFIYKNIYTYLFFKHSITLNSLFYMDYVAVSL